MTPLFLYVWEDVIPSKRQKDFLRIWEIGFQHLETRLIKQFREIGQEILYDQEIEYIPNA